MEEEKVIVVEGSVLIHNEEDDFEMMQRASEENMTITRGESVRSSDSRKSLRRTLTMQEFIDEEEKKGSHATFFRGLFGKKITVFFLLACMVVNSYVTEIINLVSTISPIVQQPSEIVLGESIMVSCI